MTIFMKKTPSLLCASTILLVACHDTGSMADLGALQSAQKDSSDQDSGHTLTDLAGKAVMPIHIEQPNADHVLTQQAQKFSGRYVVEMSCSDAFVQCEQGTAQFILNLMPNGIAHRSIVHLGKITFNSSHQYQQDRWMYDAMLHQIILQRENGVRFYYSIEPDQSLKMDLDKISTELSHEYLVMGSPLPQQAYVLKKQTRIK